MAFFENILGKKDDFDIEDFLNKLDDEDTYYEDADAFVKPISLNDDPDVQVVINETKAGNIVLLDIQPLLKRNALKLKSLIGQLKQEIGIIDGDIARISEEKIILTPHRVKIYKKKALL